jgi:hypothetical protein
MRKRRSDPPMRYYEEGARWYDLFSTGTPGDLNFYLKEARKTSGNGSYMVVLSINRIERTVKWLSV